MIRATRSSLVSITENKRIPDMPNAKEEGKEKEQGKRKKEKRNIKGEGKAKNTQFTS
jgi:hypothetical protein